MISTARAEHARGDRIVKTLMRAAAVVGTAAVLVGCATAAQRELQGMAAGSRVAAQSFQTCTAAIYNAPELEPLRRDLPSNIRNASLEQLANSNLASDAEIRLILASHPKLQACRQHLVDQLSQTMPTVVPILVRMTTTEDNYLIALLQRELRWGEFLQRVRDAVNQGDVEITAESKRMMAGLQQAHEAELEQRHAALQAIGNALAEYGRTQQMISGIRINCTTMEIRPGFSTTNCN
jgi:hypothetical protein